MNRSKFPALVLITGLLILGCSGSGSGTNPMLPGLSPESQQNTSQSIEVHRDLWGWWEVAIDPIGGSVEIVPIRSAMFRANVTQWMQPPVGSLSNLQIDIVDMSTYMTDGRIVVDVSLTHPFAGLVEYTGFDVNGIFINDWSAVDSLNPDIAYTLQNIDAAILENPDGETRWFNYPEFAGGVPILGYTPGELGTIEEPSATLNPYKYFSDDINAETDLFEYFSDELNIENRGMFSQGVTNARRYNLQFPIIDDMPVLMYQYAVAASWEEGDPTLGGDPDTWDTPDDFPISANLQEPFFLNIDSSDSDIYFDDTDSSYGGNLVLDIEVFSWQHLDPASDGISKITISSCETCTILPVALTFEGPALDTALIPGSGTSVSDIYHFDLASLVPTANGPASLLVSVEPANPASYDQGFGTPIPDGALAAYQLHWLNISTESGCTPPAADAVATTSTDINIGGTVDFDASGTTGTPPFTWDWDWDGDDVFDEMTTDPLITHQFDDAGTFEVMCRATNDCGQDLIDTPIQVNVNACGSDLPTFSQRFQGVNNGLCPYYYTDLDSTINDPTPKLVAPGSFGNPTQHRKIYLALPSDPTTYVAEWQYSGPGDWLPDLEVDGSTSGIDRIIFKSNYAGDPFFIDWNGTSFSNFTTLPQTPYGSIWSMTVTDVGDLIAHNNIGPNTSVYRWDKSNGYAVEMLFQFQNTSGSIPYGSLGKMGDMCYYPETETILFPVSNGAVSQGGQLYGFSYNQSSGQWERTFADTNVYGASVGGVSWIYGVTVDMQAPQCRVLFHGAPNNGSMWIARFTNDLQDKYVTEITDSQANAGGKHGCFIGNDFWTNTNNWNWHTLRYTLPADW